MLQLTDLTIACASSHARRRELLRWRDLAAALYLHEQPDADMHRQMFLCLLQFTPTAFQQTVALFGDQAEVSAGLRAR